MSFRFDSTIEELRHLMSYAYEMLTDDEDKSDPGRKLGLVYEPSRYHMMNEQVRDSLISARGFRDYLPFIQSEPGIHRNNNDTMHGYGLALYETRTDDELKKPLRYVMAHIPSELEGEIESYMIALKENVPHILDYFKRIEVADEVIKVVKPILDEPFLQDIIDSSVGFLMRRDEIARYNVRLRRGILLDGDPGNGKTMTMRYIRQRCQEENIRTRNITATELMRAFADNQLEEFMSCAPVMFFDDIDTSFFNRNRGQGGDGRMCCALLSAMDGMNESEHCIRIFSTNEQIKDMDPAFKRPGRIDRVFHFGLPSPTLRRRLIRTWHQEILEGLNAEDVVARTNDFSFAETESIKDLLVTNKIFGDGTWNLDRALEMFNDTQAARDELDEMRSEHGESAKGDKARVDVPVEPEEPAEVALQGT